MSILRWLSPLFLIFSAIMVAALVLAYYSYRSVDQLAARSEATVASSNRVLGLKLIERIEGVIIDNDRTFFKLVNLDDPKEFIELWRRIIRISPVVESVMVLDAKQQPSRFLAKLKPTERRWFKKVLLKHLVPEMNLHKLPRDMHKHLHKRVEGKSYLLSYIRRSDYYIVLSMNISYLLNELFVKEFKEIEKTRSIAVMDEGGRVLHGSPVATDDTKLVFEGRFATTLYKWRLQVAPRDVEAMREETTTRRMLHLGLVGTAVGVIFLGILAMVAAVRKQRRMNELKSEFIANVSHELKTPLSLIRMFSELLALGRAKEGVAKEYAEIITRESDRLTSLIDNVLDFARIERGKAAYEFARGDLSVVVRRGMELVALRCEQGGIELDSVVEDQLPETEFDESAMTLLLLNLLENAIKYGTSKGGTVTISLGKVDDHHLRLSVSDDGPGIAAEEHRRIFDRFYRGPVSPRSTRGSGIGLSLVKHIAEAHGGSVSVKSELGKGATFEVIIPVL